MGGQIRVSRAAPLVDTSTLVIGYGSTDYILGDGLGVGASVYQRQYAGSPFVDYQELLGVKKGPTTMTIPVIILGSSFLDFEAKLAELVEAFTQFTYTIRYVPRGEFNNVDGHFLWNCECADWAVGEGGTLRNVHWQQFAEVVTFSVPRGKAINGPIT